MTDDTLFGETDKAPAVPAKPWWQSRTMIGLAVSAVSMIASAAGYSIDAGLLTEVITQALALVGLVVAWWGRVQAKQPIDAAQIAPGVRMPVAAAKSHADPGPFGF